MDQKIMGEKIPKWYLIKRRMSTSIVSFHLQNFIVSATPGIIKRAEFLKWHVFSYIWIIHKFLSTVTHKMY